MTNLLLLRPSKILAKAPADQADVEEQPAINANIRIIA